MTQARIPTHIITGFLGVGKTTAINHLIRQKPEDEQWAIVINEFGQVGVDQTLVNPDERIAIREIPGGCVCCTMGPALTIQLAMMIRRVKPDRILIEPTGLGHPAAIIDLILSDSFNQSLALHSVISLMDPRSLKDEKTRTFPTFIDQLQMADIVALNKVDLCTQAEIKNAYNFLDALYPAKQEVIEITQAALPIERLIGEHDSNRKASFPSFHSEASARSSTNPLTSRLSPLPIASISGFLNPTKGKPYISFYDDGTVFGVSAIYHPEDILNLDSVNALLDEYKDSLRCKAVIRQTQTSALFNITQGEKEQASSAWRRDSRIEILQYTPFDQNALRHQFNVILSTS